MKLLKGLSLIVAMSLVSFVSNAAVVIAPVSDQPSASIWRHAWDTFWFYINMLH